MTAGTAWRDATAAAVCLWLASTLSAVALEIRTAVLRVDYDTLAPITRYDLRPDDLGFAGAALGTEDNATTGGFLGHSFALTTRAAAPADIDTAVDELLAEAPQALVVLARADDLLRIADAVGDRAIVLNAQAPDTALRDADCRANLLHVTPSRAMQADAVAQFAVWKQWPSWYLVHGSNPDDILLADAYRRAAQKFGGRIVDETEIEDTGGSRRVDTGHVLVQRQIPVLLQDARDHDVVIAADESDVFAPYLPFNLWTPRPTMGSAGLRPVSFHAAHEAWGATQFQTRFEELTGRYVQDEDYDAWVAVRALGEAVTRASSDDPAALRDYMLSDAFELGAFKGQAVTFRNWNGQLRQPVLLFDGRITVSVSPQEGFLHQVSPLDTLGLDRPESACTAFTE